MQGIVAQPAPPQHYFGSEIRRLRLSVQGKGESRVEQDRGCWPDDPISLFRSDESGFALTPKGKTPLKSPGLDLVIPVLKAALSVSHFQNNAEVEQAVRQFLASLGTEF